jgi:hypothetical protein
VKFDYNVVSKFFYNDSSKSRSDHTYDLAAKNSGDAIIDIGETQCPGFTSGCNY